MKNYLDFEAEIKDIELEINNVKDPCGSDGLTEVDIWLEDQGVEIRPYTFQLYINQINDPPELLSKIIYKGNEYDAFSDTINIDEDSNNSQ